MVRTAVRKRKQQSYNEQSEDDEGTGVVTAHAIPISEKSGRILLSQTELGQIYYKGYMADNALKPLPRQLEGATLSSMFQLVCICNSNKQNEYSFVRGLLGPDMCVRTCTRRYLRL
jgi:hypothetical protein